MLAAAFRLLDLGFFRVGGETYAEDNGTYGLATMRRKHVTVTGDVVTFDYIAKSGKQRVQSVVDPKVRKVVKALLDRDGGGEELLAYKEKGEWRDISSADINAYLREVIDADVSAKDFRTWHATVLMAVGLAVSTGAPTSPTARKRAVSRAVSEVAELPRQHPGRVPVVVHRSSRDRPVRRRGHRCALAGAPRRRGVLRSTGDARPGRNGGAAPAPRPATTVVQVEGHRQGGVSVRRPARGGGR